MRRKTVGERTAENARATVVNSVEQLEALNRSYDEGKYHFATTIAQVVFRVATEELQRTGLRKEVTFISFADRPESDALSAQNLLVGWLIGRHEADVEIGVVEFVPKIDRKPREALNYNKWWTSAIYVAGAGDDDLMIPLWEKEQTPFNKRKRYSRNNLIERTRNEIGAHYDQNITKEFEDYWGQRLPFQFMLGTPSGNTWNTRDHPEKFIFKNCPADAIIRAISEELVQSCQRWNF